MPNIADTTAAPAMLTIGRLWARRDLLISPLTLRDLGWYERMGGQVDMVGREGAILLIWLGLRKHQPRMTLRKCRKLFRRRSWFEQASQITDQINPGTFEAVSPESEQDDLPVVCRGHVNIMRGLAASFQWGPEIAFDLTAEQAHLYMVGDMSKSISSIPFESKADADAYVAERKAAREGGGQDG